MNEGQKPEVIVDGSLTPIFEQLDDLGKVSDNILKELGISLPVGLGPAEPKEQPSSLIEILRSRSAEISRRVLQITATVKEVRSTVDLLRGMIV